MVDGKPSRLVRALLLVGAIAAAAWLLTGPRWTAPHPGPARSSVPAWEGDEHPDAERPARRDVGTGFQRAGGSPPLAAAPTSETRSLADADSLAQPEGMTLVVLSEAGRPLENVEVVFRDLSGAERLERSDSRGTVQVPRKAIGEIVSFRASAAGHAPQTRTIRVVEAGTVYVLLQPAVELAGVVRHVYGRAASGAKVLGWPSRLALPSGTDLEGILASSTLVLLTTADENGAFALEGAAEDSWYYLIAGAPGYLGRQQVLTSPARGPAELEVWPCYALGVRLVNSQGLSHLPSAFKAGQPYLAFTALQDDLEPLQLPLTFATLAGASPYTLLSEDGLEVRLFCQPDDTERAGPIEFAHDLVGFQPQRLDLWASRLDAGWAPYPLNLVPARNLVEIEVIVELGERLPEESAPLPERFGSVRLQDEGRDVYEVPIRSLEAPTSAAIPSGTYAVEFVSASGFYRKSLHQRLEVQPGEHTLIRVPVDGCGSVDVRLMKKDGSYYAGRTKVTIGVPGPASPSGPGGGITLHRRTARILEARPYQLSFLQPGRYRLMLGGPGRFRDADGRGGPHDLVVQAGETTVLELHER